MRSTIYLGAAAALALIVTDPAICGQAAQPLPPPDSSQPAPPEDPSEPGTPMPDPATPPQPQPLPPEMPMPASPPAPSPAPVINTDAPMGPMATPPTAGADAARSGGTTSTMMQPVAATKEYPPCSKTLQDNCRNPGEGPRRTARRTR